MSVEIKEPTLDSIPRKAQDPEDQAMYDEYFARGGKVTIVDTNARTESYSNNPWQRSKGRPKEKK